MGDPKKLKRKYASSSHPWIRKEIELNKELRKEYGLRNRKEILIAQSFLKKYMDLAKKLIANKTPQGEKEKKQILDKLHKLGLLPAGAQPDDILTLKLKDILERRIQTLIFRKGLTRTIKQARQFITHRHVALGDKEITSPSSLLSLEEESRLNFKGSSALAEEKHPERINLAQAVKAEKEVFAKKKEDSSPEKMVKETKEEVSGKK